MQANIRAACNPKEEKVGEWGRRRWENGGGEEGMRKGVGKMG